MAGKRKKRRKHDISAELMDVLLGNAGPVDARDLHLNTYHDNELGDVEIVARVSAEFVTIRYVECDTDRLVQTVQLYFDEFKLCYALMQLMRIEKGTKNENLLDLEIRKS